MLFLLAFPKWAELMTGTRRTNGVTMEAEPTDEMIADAREWLQPMLADVSCGDEEDDEALVSALAEKFAQYAGPSREELEALRKAVDAVEFLGLLCPLCKQLPGIPHEDPHLDRCLIGRAKRARLRSDGERRP
jgi:hypothetical protein